MKVKIVAIRDSKAQSFGDVSSCTNLAVAERSFEDLLTDSKSIMGRHKSDFSIWLVGEFDTETGELLPALHEIANGKSYEA